MSICLLVSAQFAKTPTNTADTAQADGTSNQETYALESVYSIECSGQVHTLDSFDAQGASATTTTDVNKVQFSTKNVQYCERLFESEFVYCECMYDIAANKALMVPARVVNNRATYNDCAKKKDYTQC